MSELNLRVRKNLDQPETLVTIVANTYTYAVCRGISAYNIHAATGVSRFDLLNPEARLAEDSVPMMWNLLSQAYPEQVLTLHMASGTPLSYFGSLAQGAQHANTLRTALQVVVRYRAVLSDRLCIDLVEAGTEAILRLHHPSDEIDSGCSTEVTLAMLKRLMQAITGVSDSLVRVELVCPPHRDMQDDEIFWGVPIRFQQAHHQLVLHRAALDLPTRQPDARLFQYVQGNLDLQLKGCRRSDSVSLLSELQQAIARNFEAGEYTAAAVARQMNMSLRALQRLTKEQGLMLRQLLETAREDRARQLLVDPTLGVETISSQLGYSDDRAFRRAFKRWTGQTPAEFRQQ